MQIGQRIRKLRKDKGITQEHLAQFLRVSYQAVSKWENNIALPYISIIPALADYFQVSIDELFDYKKERNREDIEKICKAAYPFREKDPAAARRIPYKAKGKNKDAEDALEQIPQMHFTRLSESAFIKEGKQKYEAASR